MRSKKVTAKIDFVSKTTKDTHLPTKMVHS